MPPNTQNQVPPTQSGQPTPSNIPDFLQLEPVEDPSVAKRKQRKTRAVIFGTIALLILAVALTFVIVWLQGARERQLYQALDGLMQSSYLAREYTVKVNAGNTDSISISATSESDCTAPADCKSKLEYEYSSKGVLGSDLQIKAQGVIDADYEYMNIASAPASFLQKDLTVNQWYRLSSQGGLVGKLLPLQPYSGVVVAGNLDENKRAQLIDYIKTNKIYSIESAKDNVANGTSYTVYTLKTSAKKLEGLRAKTAELVGGKAGSASSLEIEPSSVEIWVNNATEQVTKVFVKQAKDQTTTETQIDFSYPSSVAIDMPTNSKTP